MFFERNKILVWRLRWRTKTLDYIHDLKRKLINICDFFLHFVKTLFVTFPE